MAVNRAHIVDQNFIDSITSLIGITLPPESTISTLTNPQLVELMDSMFASRHLDIHARELKAEGECYYTIGGSGHECNSAVAFASRPTDPAFLHYRAGAFFQQRAKQLPGQSPIYDVLLGLVASSDEPISGGRHKVFGSTTLSIPPQTSTIASHLPKAVGAAFSIARSERLGIESDVPADSIVICTFGDASSNHSSACGAFNAAAIADHQNLPCPILFVCEDNGIGISVRTPKNWLYERFKSDPGIKYFFADGTCIEESARIAKEAVDYVRKTRRPTFLHLRVIRLLGHAGSDVEQLYRSLEEIESLEAQDPVLQTARLVIRRGICTAEQVLEHYQRIRENVVALGKEALSRPKLTNSDDIVKPLAPLDSRSIKSLACSSGTADERTTFFGRLPETDRPRHMAMLLNRALGDLLITYPNSLIFGEDVGKKGGVYHVTADLQKKAGIGRVFNTPLDETTILGLAIGAGHVGFLPIPEIQYLAYLHNAIDQIRGEAASLQFFSNGQFQNPMVIRIASYAYQKGFGGHFHNTNSVAALRDIPGLIIASPSNGHDAVLMLRTCMAASKHNGLVTVFLEPIALYMTKDLHKQRDGLWSSVYPSFENHIAIGEGRVRKQGKDLTIISYANGLYMSLRVAKRLQAEGIDCHVVDLCWINPMPEQLIIDSAEKTGTVLVVDECRKSGGMAEPILALIAESCPTVKCHRISGLDTYIPLGGAANKVLIQEEDIEKTVREIINSGALQ